MPATQSACLISDKRACHSTSIENQVFVIGSGSPEFKEDIGTIMDVLDELGFKGYFALLSEDAKGLDAFCDKICSKIRESQFCVALLNEPVASRHVEGSIDSIESIRVPSANVYYEFGMAVALGKSVIPVIRAGAELPFDVQHLDSVIYAGVGDLKSKLRKPIVATLQKKPREASIAPNLELVRCVYGPLYNEVDRFLSRRDKFSPYARSEYGTVFGQHKYLYDMIEENLGKEIILFYEEIEEFNNNLSESEKIVQSIILTQIPNFFKTSHYSINSVSVKLETDNGGHIKPAIDKVLIRKTTPELFLHAQGINEKVKNIEYRLSTLSAPGAMVKIEPEEFKRFFAKCQELVENNPRVIRLRALETDLDRRGEQLKEKLKELCR